MPNLLISASLCLVLAISATQSDDIACEEPPPIEFASITDITDEDYSIGATATYGCEYGYVVSGKSRTVKCELYGNDADWTEPEFTCIPQSCGDPGYVHNGRRIGALFTFPNSVTYQCDEGYKLRGLATRYCQTSGSWSGKLPICEVVRCDSPENPNNGYVTAVSNDFGSELKYRCHKGFHLNTEETVFCTKDGSWSRTDVDCVESVCDKPLEPEYGSVTLAGTNDAPRAGSIAVFSCEGDRIAFGPTTSKCLDTGQWTFPPPQCLEPCSIPHIVNGKIGRYEGYYRRKTFKEIRIGTRVEDNDELSIRCNNGYEAIGSENNEEKISCNHGKWSAEPRCDPAFCRSKPPSIDNGEIVSIELEHGGIVTYHCSSDYRKVRTETIICYLGVWQGETPMCKSTKCSIDDLKFPGLVKGRKSSYRDGELFKIECDGRYKISKGDGSQLRCKAGTWTGHLPPCVAASCTDPPPAIRYGRTENFPPMAHSSIAKYVCEEPYRLVERNRVQCSFGKWEGEPPKCEDSRCYLENLKYFDHVSSETQQITHSGDTLNIVCEEGYTVKKELPYCLNGVWYRDSESHCKEKDCVVPSINNGEVREEKFGDWFWNFRKFSYERNLEYKKVPVGKIAPRGTELWLYCTDRYFVHGSGEPRTVIRCIEGKWSPDLVCLRYGVKYIPPTAASHITRFTSVLETHRGSSIATTKATPPSTTTTTDESWTASIKVDEVTPDIAATPNFVTEAPVEECFCEYPIDDENLFAYADGKRLNYEDKVREGSTVVFRCQHVGYHRFNGRQEISCDNCQPWHSSDFPSCIEPQSGNTVIISDKNVNISIEGNFEIRNGQSANFTCIGMETAKYPKWNVPTGAGISITSERRERETYGDVLYLSHLHIENATYENEGTYGCVIKNNPITSVYVSVVDSNLRCPKFPQEDDVIVEYDGERRVKSKALFSCLKKGQELIGKDVLTCLRSEEWSDLAPNCTEVKCRELKGNDLLQIHYNMDRQIGSLATFHCFSPGKRSGVSFAKCLENGSWSDPTPTCRAPPCSVDDLLSRVPQNIVLIQDGTDNSTLPYNSTIKMTCADEMVALGNPVAKCGKNQEWIIDSVQCVTGCLPVEKIASSKLMVKPEKELYKFGELLAFSCPPGMNLNTESQLMMCLKNGWSETIIPECEGSEQFEEYEDTENTDQAVVEE